MIASEPSEGTCPTQCGNACGSGAGWKRSVVLTRKVMLMEGTNHPIRAPAINPAGAHSIAIPPQSGQEFRIGKLQPRDQRRQPDHPQTEPNGKRLRLLRARRPPVSRF